MDERKQALENVKLCMKDWEAIQDAFRIKDQTIVGLALYFGSYIDGFYKQIQQVEEYLIKEGTP